MLLSRVKKAQRLGRNTHGHREAALRSTVITRRPCAAWSSASGLAQHGGENRVAFLKRIEDREVVIPR